MILVGLVVVMGLVPVPSIGVGIVAAGASYVIEQAAQPVIGWMAEKLARGIYAGYETVFGDTDEMTFDELQARRRQIKADYQERIRQQKNQAQVQPKSARKINEPLTQTYCKNDS